MEGIFVSWEEKLKESTSSAMPKLEELLKDAEKKFGTAELSATEAQRYRRVLGQFAWAALSRADLAFPVGFLSRFQSKPHVPAEICLRCFLRWLKGHLHFVQQMPASSPPVLTEEGVVVGFGDASWNVTSVSGAVISWRGCCFRTLWLKASRLKLAAKAVEQGGSRRLLEEKKFSPGWRA